MAILSLKETTFLSSHKHIFSFAATDERVGIFE